MLSLSRLLRAVRVRPRLLIGAACACAVGGFLPEAVATHAATRWLVGWNAGTLLYILLTVVMMLRSEPHDIRQRAQSQDDGQHLILALVVLSALASLVAIAVEVSVVKDLHGLQRFAHLALAGLTVVSSWAFIQVMFTLHYAHDYYAAASRGEPPGLRFPEDEAPEYGDFFYFAAVIGTSGQTADVTFVSKPLRRVGALHCILAYLFNTTVLALLINIGASLI